MPRRPTPRVVSVVLLTGLWLYGEVPAANAQPASPSTPQQAPQTPPLNPTQEVAGETAAGPSIAFGPLQVRLGGYIGLTGIYRSTNSGGGVGTGFASTPYQDTIQGEVSEAQAQRAGLEVVVTCGR